MTKNKPRWRRVGLLRLILALPLTIGLNACSKTEGDSAGSSSRPSVVASIRPIGLIASAIAGDAVHVDILLSASADPHAYALRMSDMKKINQAKAILMVDPEFERFLEKVIAQSDAAVVTMLHYGDEEGKHGHASDEHEHPNDRHPWLDPHTALATARIYTELFTALVPAQKGQFEQRLAAFERRLEQLVQQTNTQLLPFRERDYVVSHDAYRAFSEAFQLKAPLVLSPQADAQLSAQTVSEIIKQGHQAGCFISATDSQAAEKRANMLGLTLVAVDPLGWSPVATSYEALIEHIADRFSLCWQDAV